VVHLACRQRPPLAAPSYSRSSSSLLIAEMLVMRPFFAAALLQLMHPPWADELRPVAGITLGCGSLQ